MGPTLFKPSIDWSSALVDSLQWVAIAWAVGAVCLIVVLAVFRYFTPWGRQFWRITRGYFVGPDRVKVWLMLGVLLLSVLLAVRLTVLLSYQGNDLYTAVQKAVQGMAAGDDAVRQSGIHGFWMSLAIFSVLATL
ncbi:MAG TPA: ABC transporter ATP-binding protein/permease, partial [Mycobacterium sp.]|nr:ABC transporter ATP-binding protein/permease [Mycobacterium sp.]